MSSSNSTRIFSCRYRDIAGFPGYRIDEHGTAWTCWIGGRKSRPGAIWRPLKGRPMKHGHIQVGLYGVEKPKNRLVHHLVLEAFVGPRPDGMECLHGDGNPANNRLSNLRWGTHAENQADSVRHGTAYMVKGANCGEASPHAKLTQAQVERIMEIWTSTTLGAVKICRILGIPVTMRSSIDSLTMGKSWNHVTGLPPYRPKVSTEAQNLIRGR